MAEINLPEDIILPIPESIKEQELYKTLQDNHKQVRDSFAALEDVAAITAGTGLTDTSDTFSVNVDDSTIEISGGNLSVKDDGITGAKLAAAVAGLGLTQDGSGNLDVNVDDSTLEVATDTLQVKDGGIATTKLTAIAPLRLIGNTTGGWDIGVVEILDDDTMAADRDDVVCTQQSIKAYIDSSGGTSGSEIFTTAGADTFTVPIGVTKVFVTLVGGGGGGASPATPAFGGGGGSGAAIINFPYTVTPEATVNLNVGAKGSGAAAGAGDGSNGTASTFDATITADFGNGATGSTGGSGGTAPAGTGDAPAVPTAGSLYVPNGYDGGDGATTGGVYGGGGAGSIFGAGGDGGGGAGNSSPATSYGAGGGGADNGSSNNAAGDGTDGIVIVRW